MAASPSKTKQKAATKDIISIARNMPVGPAFYNEETGEHFQLGEVVVSGIDPTKRMYTGHTPEETVNSLLTLLERNTKDERYHMDFDLVRHEGPESQFLKEMVLRHGERPV